MVFIAVHNYAQHKRMSLSVIAITAIVFILSIVENLQLYTKDTNNIIATEILSYIGYTFRPLCLVGFIVFSYSEPKGKWLYAFLAPLLINFIVYLFAFFPATQQAVFYFHYNDEGGISFGGGLLRFTSHFISALYLIYFLYNSIARLRNKHIANANILIICSLLIIACVVVETAFDEENNIHLLNTAIMVCVMFYYLFLHMESTKYDALTGLFNRATFYQDIAKMDKTITAIIQFDMNGLKYFNDNFGHLEGDKALTFIANTMASACDKDMYPYRISGDEFLIIVNHLPVEVVESTIENIKGTLRKSKYSCSIGYAYRHNKNVSVAELMKESEKAMYVAKAEFYKNSNLERRKSGIDNVR